VAADVTLAAYVNESMRYRVIGRLRIGSAIGTPPGTCPSSQAGHKAEADDSGANDGHNPMDPSLGRPPVPTASVVSNCQISKSSWGIQKADGNE